MIYQKLSIVLISILVCACAAPKKEPTVQSNQPVGNILESVGKTVVANSDGLRKPASDNTTSTIYTIELADSVRCNSSLLWEGNGTEEDPEVTNSLRSNPLLYLRFSSNGESGSSLTPDYIASSSDFNFGTDSRGEFLEARSSSSHVVNNSRFERFVNGIFGGMDSSIESSTDIFRIYRNLVILVYHSRSREIGEEEPSRKFTSVDRCVPSSPIDLEKLNSEILKIKREAQKSRKN